MRYALYATAAGLVAAAGNSQVQTTGVTEIPDIGRDSQWVIAIHGGAGNTRREDLAPAQEAALRDGLHAALEAGARVLDAGGEGPKAIEAALKILEDSPAFNAGRGAALGEHGQARHDASIMRGEDHAAGAVAGSSRIKNPIVAARAVMERTENVMLHGEGADWFAMEQGLDIVNPLYFVTDERLDQLKEKQDGPHGTVGAVVLDTHGNLAAGTSTGGRTNKRYGRVGDSPVIGAGTYASNRSCAVSATGHGEYFMRWTVARDICARVEFAGESLEQAAGELVIETLLPAGGAGAVIAIDTSGKVVFAATTANLKRGVMSARTEARVGVHSDEKVE